MAISSCNSNVKEGKLTIGFNFTSIKLIAPAGFWPHAEGQNPRRHILKSPHVI
jgi:hypothetical protein